MLCACRGAYCEGADELMKDLCVKDRATKRRMDLIIALIGSKLSQQERRVTYRKLNLINARLAKRAASL
jgi:hypothetical protein